MHDDLRLVRTGRGFRPIFAQSGGPAHPGGHPIPPDDVPHINTAPPSSHLLITPHFNHLDIQYV